MSRRKFIRRAGKGSIAVGTATWLAPMIMSANPSGAAPDPGSPPPRVRERERERVGGNETATGGGQLPRTGSDLGKYAAIGGAALAIGGAAVLAGDEALERRRQARKDDEGYDAGDTAEEQPLAES